MVWEMSKQWRIPPSDLLHIRDELAAYYLNRAVFYFGKSYEADLRNATESASGETAARISAEMVNERWMRDDLPDPSSDVDQFEIVPSGEPEGFADPGEKFH
jgi:hypothetical protein